MCVCRKKERETLLSHSLCSRWGSRDGVENEGGADESHGIRPRRYVFSVYTLPYFIFSTSCECHSIFFIYLFLLLLGFIDVMCYRCPTREFFPTLCVTDTPTFPIIFWDFSFYYCRFGFIDGAIYTWCIRPGVTRQPVWRTRRGDKKKIRRERVFSYLSIALRRQFTFGMIFISLYT